MDKKSKKELQDMAEQLGLSVKGMNKTDIIKLIQENSSEKNVSESESEGDSEHSDSEQGEDEDNSDSEVTKEKEPILSSSETEENEEVKLKKKLTKKQVKQILSDSDSEDDSEVLNETKHPEKPKKMIQMKKPKEAKPVEVPNLKEFLEGTTTREEQEQKLVTLKRDQLHILAESSTSGKLPKNLTKPKLIDYILSPSQYNIDHPKVESLYTLKKEQLHKMLEEKGIQLKEYHIKNLTRPQLVDLYEGKTTLKDHKVPRKISVSPTKTPLPSSLKKKDLKVEDLEKFPSTTLRELIKGRVKGYSVLTKKEDIITELANYLSKNMENETYVDDTFDYSSKSIEELKTILSSRVLSLHKKTDVIQLLEKTDSFKTQVTSKSEKKEKKRPKPIEAGDIVSEDERDNRIQVSPV